MFVHLFVQNFWGFSFRFHPLKKHFLISASFAKAVDFPDSVTATSGTLMKFNFFHFLFSVPVVEKILSFAVLKFYCSIIFVHRKILNDKYDYAIIGFSILTTVLIVGQFISLHLLLDGNSLLFLCSAQLSIKAANRSC